MAHSGEIKQRARDLRMQGRTHREIVEELKVGRGSAHLWTADIVLTQEQKDAILQRKNKHKFTPQEKARIGERLKNFQFKKKYSDEDLLNKIRDFYKMHGRIPLKHEFNSLRIYRERFKSWNNAIRIAGFDPNDELFAKRHVAKDGHICDSFTEKVIDDWLYSHDISHEKNWKYGATKMTADFFVKPDFVIEYFGLAGVQRDYDKIIEKKKELCVNKFRLIEIYPKDIYSKGSLGRLLNFGNRS